MFETIIVVLSGLALGVVAGVLPGLGTGGLMGILFLALMHMDPVHVLLFFVAILTSAQYFGSVIAILSGIPGDPSAIPASKWGFQLAQQGHGQDILYATAKYSFLAGSIAFVLFLLIMAANAYAASMLSVRYQAIVITVALISIAVVSDNAWYKNIALALLGLALGWVGYSVNYQTHFLTGGLNSLQFGIPWLPVLLGVMAIPGSISLFKAHLCLHENTSTQKLQPQPTAAMRGGALGFVIGLVPGLSYILSSILAAKLEERISRDPAAIVVASESANNTGAVSVLLPLLLLGVPITAAETVVFTVLTLNAQASSIPNLFLANWWVFVISFLFVNLMLFLMAWKLSNQICRLVFAHKVWFALAAICLSVSGVIWLGLQAGQLWLYLVTLLIAVLLGLRFKAVDWTPLIFAMILQEYIESTFYKIQQLYF